MCWSFKAWIPTFLDGLRLSCVCSSMSTFILFVAISLLVPLCLFIIYLFVCLSIHLFPFRLFSVQKFCLSSTSSFPSSPSPLPSLSKEDSKLLSLSLLLLLLLLFFNRRMYQIWGQIKNYQFWRQAEQQKNKLEKRFFRKMLELKKQLEKAVMSWVERDREREIKKHLE